MNRKDLKILFNAIFKSYAFSDLSKIGPLDYKEYVEKLNPAQTVLINDKKFKWIQWEDDQTYYLVKFSKRGRFIRIEREIWFEYTFPWFKKKIIFDSSVIIVKSSPRRNQKI